MRTFTLSLLILTIGITATMGGARGRKGMKFFKEFAEGQGKGKGHCKDPAKIFAMIFGMICDVENCAANAPKCMDAIKLPGDLCEYVRECKHRHGIDVSMEDDSDEDADGDIIFGSSEEDDDEDSNSSEHRPKWGPRSPKDKKRMMSCIMEKAMESVGLVYVPDDFSSNVLALLKVTVNDNPEITDATKSNMLSAVYDGVCHLPAEMMKMNETLAFNICLMKTCVKSMVPS